MAKKRTIQKRREPEQSKNDAPMASAASNIGATRSPMVIRVDSKIGEQEIADVNQLTAELLSADYSISRHAARDTIHCLTTSDAPPPDLTAEIQLKFAISVSISVRRLRGYATLDDGHAADIDAMLTVMEQYIDDQSRKRPKNFLMLASPGAGKSHFIGCVADHLESRRVAAITFNMASMSSSEELGRALDEARNAKVDDRVPLLFLDEFDSSDSNFAMLLPLLWDGAMSVGQRTLKLGRVIVVLAGSDPTLPDTLAHAKSFRSVIPLEQGRSKKLIDLFSRINGSVVTIPPFQDVSKGIDRRADKVAIAIQLLRRRFGKDLSRVSLAFFRLIAKATFRYDVRSIAHLVDIIPPLPPGVTTLATDALGLPFGSTQELRDSSLAYHLVDDVNHAHGVIDLWRNEQQHNGLIRIDVLDQVEKYVLSDQMNHIRLYGLATVLQEMLR